MNFRFRHWTRIDSIDERLKGRKLGANASVGPGKWDVQGMRASGRLEPRSLEPLPKTPIRQGHATTGGLVIALIGIVLLVIISL